MSKNNVANDLELLLRPKVLSTNPHLLEKNRTFKNIVNGHINTEDLWEGRSRSDTYRVRSDNLVKKPNEIVNLTGCAELGSFTDLGKGYSMLLQVKQF